MKLDSKGCLIIFVFEISYVLRRIQRRLREILTCVYLGGTQPLRKSGVCGCMSDLTKLLIHEAVEFPNVVYISQLKLRNLEYDRQSYHFCVRGIQDVQSRWSSE